MSARTKSELEKRLEKAMQELVQTRLDKGEAGGSSDWHDNAVLDEASRKEDLFSIQVDKLSRKLHNVELIKPRQETDGVGLGNKVSLKFDLEEETVEYNVLGPDDAIVSNNSISIESPVGRAILGKKVGDVVEYEAGKSIMKVRVVNVLPGDFE